MKKCYLKTAESVLALKDEVFKQIDGFENLYLISSLGRVYSIRNRKFIAQYKNRYGYLKCSLKKEGKNKSVFVHRLVATAFISNPNNKPEVNHKNGIKTDNSLNNLEWCSRLENVRHSWKLGLSKHTEKLRICCIKAHEIPVICIENGSIFDSLAKASDFVGVSRSLMTICCRDNKRKANGFHFRKLTPLEVAELTGYKVEEAE